MPRNLLPGDGYDGSSDSDNLFGVSIPSSVAYNANLVSSAKTLSKFNIGENFSQLTSQEKVNEKRVASSLADGDIPPKRSGIPRVRQVHKRDQPGSNRAESLWTYRPLFLLFL